MRLILLRGEKPGSSGHRKECGARHDVPVNFKAHVHEGLNVAGNWSAASDFSVDEQARASQPQGNPGGRHIWALIPFRGC